MKEKTRDEFHHVIGPRTHENCKAQTGVMRPGKTVQEKYCKATKAAKAKGDPA